MIKNGSRGLIGTQGWIKGGGGELNTGWSGQQDWDLASDLSNFFQRIEISKFCNTIIKFYVHGIFKTYSK